MFPNLFNFSEPAHSFHFSDLEQVVLAGGVGKRLLMACLLGNSGAIESAALKALDSQGKRLFKLERDVIAQIQRGSFSVLGTLGQHQVLMAALRASPVIGPLLAHHDAEGE
jgi:hypothetical protein